ncbi:MAG TPA: tetratricopeptide repeat protein [Methylomirabilota bacterium]|nr:tetratricopeptide repeat protein [Methylomirabilota bacterium]
MRPARHGGWRLGLIAGLCGLASSGCATLDRTADTFMTPVKYAWVGADSGLRTNLERGLGQLEAADAQGAVRALNDALWDLQRIEDRGLRMGELARAHRAMGEAYARVRKPGWAEDEWSLATAFAARSREAPVLGDGSSALARGKAAYMSAQFPDSVSWLRRALVDLEEADGFFARLKHREEAHCYLGFAYVALGQEERAKEEFQRLVALDPSVTSCSCMAAPKVRRLINEVQRRTAR